MKKGIGFRTVSGILFVVLLIVFTAVGAIMSGKRSLSGKSDSSAPYLEMQDTLTDTADVPCKSSDDSVIWKDGWVRYNGEIYEYKEGILTFLIMGIDKEGVNTAESGSLDGGQADFQILLVLDPTTKRIEIIPINRNTMVDVDVYDSMGTVIGTTRAQISVQHGVGNGAEESCEYQVRAVSRFFYQLPIHGYAAMQRDGIAALADSVGGVDVIVPEDNVTPSITFRKGEQLHLEGDQAKLFLWDRDQELGGADRRLERQKVFLKAFLEKMVSTVRKNPAAITGIYSAVSRYVTTDIELSEALYLGSTCAGYTYDSDSFHTIAGETVEGEISDEFYADQDDLRRLMIEVFYEKVDLPEGN